jgi:arsenate reductase
MFPKLAAYIDLLPLSEISTDRKEILQLVIDYIRSKRGNDEPVKLNFICTHNSRRSQLAQIWSQTAANYYKIAASCYSGGVEVTAFNENAVAAIIKAGFDVSSEGDYNPIYLVSHSTTDDPTPVFSKLYDDMTIPNKGFVAIMTCSDADENCPFIPGAETRIPLLYADPKEFDETPIMAEKYDERSRQIATEMFYIFSKVNAK